MSSQQNNARAPPANGDALPANGVAGANQVPPNNNINQQPLNPHNADAANNAPPLAPADILNQSMQTMAAMAVSFSLNNAVMRVPYFDGRSISLKDFIQDIRNGAAYINADQQAAYVTAVLGKLQGAARDSTNGKIFNTVDALVNHLKKRFAPGKTYSYFLAKVNNLQMRQGDTVGDFYDRLNVLLSGAKSALLDELLPGERAQLESMMTPLKITAKDVFIRGLPPDIARMVDNHQPLNLTEAYDHATRIESRMEAKIIPDTRDQGCYPDSRRTPPRRSYNNAPPNYAQNYMTTVPQPRQGNQGPILHRRVFDPSHYDGYRNWNENQFLQPPPRLRPFPNQGSILPPQQPQYGQQPQYNYQPRQSQQFRPNPRYSQPGQSLNWSGARRSEGTSYNNSTPTNNTTPMIPTSTASNTNPMTPPSTQATPPMGMNQTPMTPRPNNFGNHNAQNSSTTRNANPNANRPGNSWNNNRFTNQRTSYPSPQYQRNN